MLLPNDRSALCLMARNVSPSISHSCARWNLQKYCSSFMGVCRFSRCPVIGYSATTWHVPRKWTNGRALENQNQKWPNIHLNFISCSFVSKILAPTLRALGLGSLPHLHFGVSKAMLARAAFDIRNPHHFTPLENPQSCESICQRAGIEIENCWAAFDMNGTWKFDTKAADDWMQPADTRCSTLNIIYDE